MANPSSSSFELYYNPYSICSLMALYTVALRGQPKDLESEMHIQRRVVDIFHEEQLEEDFLLNVNDHGQVPVLANSAVLATPIADSMKMTIYMATLYPDLIPHERQEEIKALLTELHALNYFSLSFPGRPQMAEFLVGTVQKRLDNPGLSDRYRKALEFKLGVVKRDKQGGIVPSETARNEKMARELMAKLESIMAGSDTWIYGDKPTALDAHLVPFIARMTDVGRENLFPEKLKQYGRWTMAGDKWIEIMEGRTSTMVPKS